MRRQIAAEELTTGTDKLVFLDRGLFDGEAYYIYDKLPPPARFSQFGHGLYDAAFLIEQLPIFETNEVRRENLDFARDLSVILRNCYLSRGVPVINVPVMSAEDRVDFVVGEIRRIQRTERRERVELLNRAWSVIASDRSKVGATA